LVKRDLEPRRSKTNADTSQQIIIESVNTKEEQPLRIVETEDESLEPSRTTAQGAQGQQSQSRPRPRRVKDAADEPSATDELHNLAIERERLNQYLRDRKKK